MRVTQADYSKSLGQVYQNLFTDLVRWELCMIGLILDIKKDTFLDLPSCVPNWNVQGRYLAEPKYIVDPNFRSRMKSTNSVSIDGSRPTVAVLWKDVVLQISDTFHPMNLELFLDNSGHFTSSWNQVLFLALWMSLFRRKSSSGEQASRQRQGWVRYGESISDAGSETTRGTPIYDAQAVYEVIDAD
jgi:hypothetical protein